MNISSKVVVITGGGGGIGQALATAFLDAGAEAVVLSDIDRSPLPEIAERLNCDHCLCDVTREGDVKRLVEYVVDKYGRIDLFVSNAGIPGEGSLLDASSATWQKQWEVNVLAHLHVIQQALPEMLKAGAGYFLFTASAAGLLAATGAAAYTVTKAGTVKLAEFLAITHGDDNIGVSVLCPQGVDTAMAPPTLGDGQTDGILSPEQVAECVLRDLREEKFLILPHPQVQEYVERKTANPERWLAGMRRLYRASCGVSTE